MAGHSDRLSRINASQTLPAYRRKIQPLPRRSPFSASQDARRRTCGRTRRRPGHPEDALAASTEARLPSSRGRTPGPERHSCGCIWLQQFRHAPNDILGIKVVARRTLKHATHGISRQGQTTIVEPRCTGGIYKATNVIVRYRWPRERRSGPASNSARPGKFSAHEAVRATSAPPITTSSHRRRRRAGSKSSSPPMKKHARVRDRPQHARRAHPGSAPRPAYHGFLARNVESCWSTCSGYASRRSSRGRNSHPVVDPLYARSSRSGLPATFRALGRSDFAEACLCDRAAPRTEAIEAGLKGDDVTGAGDH